MGILNNYEKYTENDCNVKGQAGRDGIGFKLTDDGNYDIDGKRLTNVADSIDDSDAVSLKVLKEHTQVSQNNYHLQSSFKIYKEFGDKSQLTVGSPPNTSPNHFFQNHKAHNDAYIIEKEGYDTGFYGEAWSSIKMKGNQLESGTYTAIFEIFVIGDAGGFRVDDTIIYQVHGDSHYTIITFDSDKINSQYTKSIIQFTTDGRAGVNDGIKLQLKYFGSQYNKNIRFLFYSRVVKGKQSTSFNHIIFNVSDAVDNHTILYFENLNLNGNLIDGLGDPVYLDSATNKKYVDVAIADKESKSNVQNYINNLNLLIRHNLPMDGRRSMTGNLNMGGNEIVNIKPFVEDDDIQPQQDNHAITFGYFHTERGELKRLINEVGYNALNRKNPDQMEDDIDMGDNRILNLKEPTDDKDVANKQYVDTRISNINLTQLLPRDGSRAMTNNLDMGDNRIENLKDPIFLQDVVNKRYLDTIISNIDPTHLLPRDGSRAMTNNLDMDNHKILNLKDPTDDKDVANKKIY